MTPNEREEIEKVAEEMVKYVFDCVQNGNSSMAHQFVEYSILTQVEKARAEERERCAKIVENLQTDYFRTVEGASEMTIEKEARKIVKHINEMGMNHISDYKIKIISEALQKKQDRIDELESALREIHRLCRTLEPLDATMRIIQVKEKAIGYGK